MNAETIWLVTILGAPLAAVLLLFLLRERGVRVAGWIAGLAAVLSLAGTFALLPVLQRGDVPVLDVQWIPDANIRLSLHMDWLTFPFLVTEATVTLLAIVYTWRLVEVAYFQKPAGDAETLSEPPRSMLAAIWLLVAANLWFGLDTDLSVGTASAAATALIGGD